jgi:hypothetical protein
MRDKVVVEEVEVKDTIITTDKCSMMNTEIKFRYVKNFEQVLNKYKKQNNTNKLLIMVRIIKKTIIFPLENFGYNLENH